MWEIISVAFGELLLLFGSIIVVYFFIKILSWIHDIGKHTDLQKLKDENHHLSGEIIALKRELDDRLKEIVNLKNQRVLDRMSMETVLERQKKKLSVREKHIERLNLDIQKKEHQLLELSIEPRQEETSERENRIAQLDIEINAREQRLLSLSQEISAVDIDGIRTAEKFIEKFHEDIRATIEQASLCFGSEYSEREFFESVITGRLAKVFEKDFKIDRLVVAANILSPSAKETVTYKTSLSNCTCEDRRHHPNQPCKHMLLLAYTFGLLQSNHKLLDSYHNQELNALMEITEEKSKTMAQISDAKKQLLKELQSLKRQGKQLKEKEQLLLEQGQDHPGFAALLQEYDRQLSQHYLKKLPDRAVKSKDIVKELTAEKKALIKERNLLFSQLAVYEDLFPWLEEFKLLPIQEAAAYARGTEEAGDEAEYFKNFLSPEEFAKLSSTERLQLSLDRWQKKKKSDWEAGIAYERYIGYLYEKEGYSVRYSGALDGLEDMGRDLIAIKGNTVQVIQCKRWKKEKTVHEKHIFQLFGTGILYSIQNPDKQISTAFVTTAALSDTARQCAERLKVQVVYKNMGSYPLIKCNINRSTGERIFHLPFDQQYDRVNIEPNRGECYVSTVAEAEALGFRHAFKHFSN